MAEHARLTTEEIEKQEVTHHGKGPSRVLSVDMLRGITVAMMILVNDPGDWEHTFRQLDHSPWNGWTATDLVFPTFLFLMGASMVFSLASRKAKGDCNWSLAGHIFARGFRIELLALVMMYLPRMQWQTMRFFGFGVLPRIAIAYVGAGLLLLVSRRFGYIASVVAVLLVGYYIVMRFVPVPGYGVPGVDIPLLDQTRNWVSYIDRAVVAWTQTWLHTGALYQRGRDPEGLLSTLPAIATVLLGAMTGLWFRKATRGEIRMHTMRVGLEFAGLASFAAGVVWSHWMPVNKNLWTPSFVLLCAGVAAMLLAACSWLVDGRKGVWPLWLRGITWPWFVYGANAMAAFIVSEAIVKIAVYIHWTDADGHGHTPWGWTYEHLFAFHGSNVWTSLAFAVAFVVLCLLPNWWMWHKRIFLKI